MLRNYQLFQKLKLLGNGEFNHLTNILTQCFPIRFSRIDLPGFFLVMESQVLHTAKKVCRMRV
jgi:hypothetical protein